MERACRNGGEAPPEEDLSEGTQSSCAVMSPHLEQQVGTSVESFSLERLLLGPHLVKPKDIGVMRT